MREGGSRHLREIVASELHFGGWMRYAQLEMTRQGAGMVKRGAEAQSRGKAVLREGEGWFKEGQGSWKRKQIRLGTCSAEAGGGCHPLSPGLPTNPRQVALLIPISQMERPRPILVN